MRPDAHLIRLTKFQDPDWSEINIFDHHNSWIKYAVLFHWKTGLKLIPRHFHLQQFSFSTKSFLVLKTYVYPTIFTNWITLTELLSLLFGIFMVQATLTLMRIKIHRKTCASQFVKLTVILRIGSSNKIGQTRLISIKKIVFTLINLVPNSSITD